MERVRMLSQARSELFALFEEVTTHRERKIILRHRGSEHDAVLVSREYLQKLEDARSDVLGAPFTLFGSAVMHQDVEEALTEVREDARVALDKKLSRLASGSAISSAPPKSSAKKPTARRGSIH